MTPANNTAPSKAKAERFMVPPQDGLHEAYRGTMKNPLQADETWIKAKGVSATVSGKWTVT
jgi:hypothetical protein